MAEHRKMSQSLTLEGAFSKLVSVIRTIESRQHEYASAEELIRPHEAKRVKDAFDLIHQARSHATSEPEGKRDKFCHFLLQLEDDELVVASALGLGKAAIANMKEARRLHLPDKLKRDKKDFWSPFLQPLAQMYSRDGKVS